MAVGLVEAGSGGASADEIMPVLIFTLLRGRVAQLNSNLQYISRYRDPKELASEKAYHFTSLLAAASFIEKMDQKSLVIEEDEYSRRMEEAIMKLNEHTINEEEDELLARRFTNHSGGAASTRRSTATDSSASPTQRTGGPRSPELRIKEEAGKVFEKIKLGASKSIDYLGKLMDEAEAKLARTMDSMGGSPRQEPDAHTLKAMRDEEEFELQLAMALSLSEQETNLQQRNKESNCSSATGEGHLIDIHESDSKSCDAQLS